MDRSALAGFLALIIAALLAIYIEKQSMVENILHDDIEHRTVARMYYSSGSPDKGSNHAYVSLVANDDLVLAGRVLGQSIKESNTQKDMVMMVTSSVSDENVNLLEKVGWRVLFVPKIENPFIKFEEAKPEVFAYASRSEWSRKWAIYCKLHIFHLTEYDIVYYLDADAIMLKNTDDIFECGMDTRLVQSCYNTQTSLIGQGDDHIGRFILCGTPRVGDHMMYSVPEWSVNAGVILVHPNEEIYQDIIDHMGKIGTNRNMGDQGLLQKYLFFVCKDNKLFSERGENWKMVFTEWFDETIRLTEDGWSGWRKRNEQNRKPGEIARDGTVCIEGNKKTCRDIEAIDYRFVPRIWPLGASPAHVDERPFEPVNSQARCYEVPRSYNFKVTDPQLPNGERPYLAHYAGPHHKPWNWRLSMHGSYWNEWFAIANRMKGPLWEDTFSLAISLVLLPVILVYGIYNIYQNILLSTLDNMITSSSTRMPPHKVEKLGRFIYLFVWFPSLCLSLCYLEGSVILYIYSSLPSRVYPLLGWISFFGWVVCVNYMILTLGCTVQFVIGRKVWMPHTEPSRLVKAWIEDTSKNPKNAMPSQGASGQPYNLLRYSCILHACIAFVLIAACWSMMSSLILQWESLGDGADFLLYSFAEVWAFASLFVFFFYPVPRLFHSWFLYGNDYRTRATRKNNSYSSSQLFVY